MTDAERKKAADLIFLALVVWREARGESPQGRLGVAYSILNRVEKPSWWGNDVVSVCTKKWQYSSMTDPKDRQLTVWPISTDASWAACLMVADAAISKSLPNPVPHADSYYDISIPAPKWATDDVFIDRIGKLRFFNVDKDIEIRR